MIPVKRPSHADTDEDLIQMQTEFLESQAKSSAQVIRNTNNYDLSSKCVTSLDKQTAENNSKDVACAIHEIKERITSSLVPVQPNFQLKPFPTVFYRSRELKRTTRGKSAFAKEFESLKQKNAHQPATSLPRNQRVNDSENITIDGPGLGREREITDAKIIHQENLAKISAMSEEDIINYQKQLLEHLGKETVDFIKTRKIQKSSVENKVEENTLSKIYRTISLPVATNDSVNEHTSVNLELNTPQLSGNSFTCSLRAKSKNETVISDRYQCSIDLVGNGTRCATSSKTKVDNDFTGNSDRNYVKIDIAEEELPIDLQEAKKWVNMDKVEYSKLAWMTLLPKPKLINSKVDYPARFDFEGKILPYEEDFPTQKGLHHHSEDPEVPGYTIEELFLLIRSFMPSQRIIALKTLACILQNNWNGMFDDCFIKPLLPELLQAGIVPLLRWCLDDSSMSSLPHAVQAVNSLIVCKADEICLDRTFPWVNGYISPFFTSSNTRSETSEIGQEELADIDIIKIDVIKGFLRMDILPRLRYIFEICYLTPTVSCSILQILIRIARHSYESSTEIMECPHLVEAIFQKFLSLKRSSFFNNKNKEMSTCPVNLAVKLMRIISSASSELAISLVEKHQLNQCLLHFLTLDPSSEILPFQEIQKLSLESLRTCQILLTYGLCANMYIDLIPALFSQLKYCQSMSITTDPDRNSHDYEYASALLNVLEVIVAAEFNKSTRLRSSVQFPSLTWNHVLGLIDITENCLKRWLHEFSSGNVPTNGTVLLASCLNFVSLFYEKCHEQHRSINVESLTRIERLCQKFLLPTLRSEKFSKLLDQLSCYSILLYRGSCGRKRDAENLSSLGSILWCGDVVPLLKEGTPFPLVSSILNLSVSLKAGHSNIINEVSEIILLHPSATEYIRKLAVSSSYFSHWFDRFEVKFICQLMLSSMKFPMCHRLALSLLSHFRYSCEWLIKDIMVNIVFNYSLLPKENHMFMAEERVPLQSKIKQKVPLDHSLGICDANIFDTIKEEHSLICSTYVKSLLSVSSLEKSRCIWERDINKIDSLSITSTVNTVLSQDWPYSPILNLYKQSKIRKIPVNSEEMISTVNNCLKWIHFSEIAQLTPVKDVLPELRFCILSTIFLIDDQLFCDDNICGLLQACLSNLVNKYEKFNFEKIHWAGTGKFEDIYQDLLKQFEAVSYKDYLFANYVTVPLQQYCNSRWKMLLLENLNVVYMLSVPLKKLVVPLKNYLEPYETETELLIEYFKMLLSGALNPQKCPLIYLMAVHHLHHFIYMDSSKYLKIQRALLKKIISLQTKEPVQHILLYSCPNEEMSIGFHVFPSLSSERQSHLFKLNDGSFSLQI